MKVAGSSIYLKTIMTTPVLLPGMVILFIPVIKSSYSLFYSNGYLLFYLVYGMLLYFYLKWTLFSYSIYIKKKKCIVQNIFGKTVEYNKVSNCEVSRLGLLSPLFKLYKVQVNDDLFYVQDGEDRSVYDKFFYQNRIVSEMNNTICGALTSLR